MKLRLNASSVVVGLAIGALAAGGITYAATNTGGTTINACQSKSTGALRILTSGVCKTTETAVAWNTQGVQGEQGAQGPQGPQGERGPATFADSEESVVSAVDVSGLWATYPSGSGRSAWVHPGNDTIRQYTVPSGVRVVIHKVVTPSLASSTRGVSGVLVQGACGGDAWNLASAISTQWFDLPDGVEDVELGRTGVGGGCVTLTFQSYPSGVQAVRLAFIQQS